MIKAHFICQKNDFGPAAVKSPTIKDEESVDHQTRKVPRFDDFYRRFPPDEKGEDGRERGGESLRKGVREDAIVVRLV